MFSDDLVVHKPFKMLIKPSMKGKTSFSMEICCSQSMKSRPSSLAARDVLGCLKMLLHDLFDLGVSVLLCCMTFGVHSGVSLCVPGGLSYPKTWFGQGVLTYSVCTCLECSLTSFSVIQDNTASQNPHIFFICGPKVYGSFSQKIAQNQNNHESK